MYDGAALRCVNGCPRGGVVIAVSLVCLRKLFEGQCFAFKYCRKELGISVVAGTDSRSASAGAGAFR
jgi:hypothetical protein